MEVEIIIDVNKDFDGIDLENAINRCEDEQTKHILLVIQHKWVIEIGKPEWSKLEAMRYNNPTDPKHDTG